MDEATGEAIPSSSSTGNNPPNSCRTKTISTEEMIKILNMYKFTQPEQEEGRCDAISETTYQSNPSVGPTISIEQMINILSLYQYNPGENVYLKRFLGNHKTFEMSGIGSRISSSFTIRPVTAGFDSLYHLLINRRERSYLYNCYAKIDSCEFGCWTSNETQQELYICNGEYRITVVYRPELVCRNNNSRVYKINIPDTCEPIGWIKTNGSVTDGSIIHVASAESPRTFKMFMNESSRNPLEVDILDHMKQRVATGKVTRWTKTRINGIVTDTSFNTVQFTVGDFNIPTRAVLFASFAVMMHDRTERSVIWCKFNVLGYILIFLLFLLVLEYL